MVANSCIDYLRNAIQVKNISRIQVGHLPRDVASKLAPLLDRQAVTVEGVINDGNSTYLQTTMP
jgi:SWI/SNF-related matrix-associated actin-dependent regulator of chromatin subfamily A3